MSLAGRARVDADGALSIGVAPGVVKIHVGPVPYLDVFTFHWEGDTSGRVAGVEISTLAAHRWASRDSLTKAELVGCADIAQVGEDSSLVFGSGDRLVRVPYHGWWRPDRTQPRYESVYVRRHLGDLTVAEILLSSGDGYAQEELDQENEEAGRFPLGPKEYWRAKMVGPGKYTYGLDGHPMTNEEFEADWA